MLQRGLGVIRSRAQRSVPKEEVNPLILFDAPATAFPKTIYTESTTMSVAGYEVKVYDGIQQQKFIKTHFPAVVYQAYENLSYYNKCLLWGACILYLYGGVYLLHSNLVKQVSNKFSTVVGPVTIAPAGSQLLRSYILEEILKHTEAIPEPEPERLLQAPILEPRGITDAKVRIYILCHTDARFREAADIYRGYKWAIPIRMKYQDCTFENAFWKQLMEIKDEWIDCDRVGTLSFSAYKKISLKDVDTIIRQSEKWDSDYHNFFKNPAALKNISKETYTIIVDTIKKLNLSLPSINNNCNYWMCSPLKMIGFIHWFHTVLRPTVLAHSLALAECKHSRDLRAEDLIKLWGKPFYPHVPFVLERLNICYFNELKDVCKDNSWYWSKQNEFMVRYGVSASDLHNPKIEFRYFCFRFLSYMRLFPLPEISLNSTKEAVLVEYRSFPHVEFLIRNSIRFLGADWSYTIVCGTGNFEFMNSLAAAIHPNIRVIRTPHANLLPSSYSALLASEYFWKLLAGEKILIYQEDSVIFRSGIERFLNWDYIGAPWPPNQDDAPILVGNGGFSLRTKSVMLDIISKIAIDKTIPNSSTAGYMKSTNSTVLPEDVYFSKNMQTYRIGRVAPVSEAFQFSTETQYSSNSFGGHNFWLNDPSWKLRLFTSLFTFAHVRTPYGLNIGGGEKYILDICNYFLKEKQCFIVLEVSEKKDIAHKTIKTLLGPDAVDNFCIIPFASGFPFSRQPSYYVSMANSTYPDSIPNGLVNIYHCQFPFETNFHRAKYLDCYDHVLLNSDFTKIHYQALLSEKQHDKITVLYPSCHTMTVFDSKKEENSFVLCGRLFNFNPNAHNKNFDKVIEAFNRSANKTYTLHIIGACYSEDWLKYLKKMSKVNVIFHIDCSDKEKWDILKKTKFMINATGLGRDKQTAAFSYEHFGISMIEGLAHGCIPITVNGGYPEYYVSKSPSPLIFDSVDSLRNLLNDIGKTSANYHFDSQYYSNLLTSFDSTHHTLTLNRIC